ncbi:MAG: DUF4915 domain-containing protein [Gammaproteobacteria bacterium]
MGFLARDTFLLTFCNQQGSLFHSLCVVDFGGPRFSWVELDSIPDEVKQDFGGVCGACRIGEQVAICTQSNKAVVAIVDPATGCIGPVQVLEGCKDLHSMVYHDGYLYVTSTGTNEIYRVKVDSGPSLGEQELFWRYPNLRYDRDEVHLNGLTVSDNRFIASCFGVRAPDESWSAAGKVFYLDSGHAIRDGLDQPHTPLVVDNQLFFAESAEKKVFAYKKAALDGWNFHAEIAMPGYTRGLALQAGKLLVGISSNRNISRSMKTAVADIRESADAAVMRVNLETHAAELAYDLSAFTREVYDIVPVNGVPLLSPPFGALSHRVREMESTIDRYMVNVQSLLSQLEEAHRQLEEAHLSLSSLQSELEKTRRTVSWWVTGPLRAGRRAIDSLLSRFRSPPMSAKPERLRQR